MCKTCLPTPKKEQNQAAGNCRSFSDRATQGKHSAMRWRDHLNTDLQFLTGLRKGDWIFLEGWCCRQKKWAITGSKEDAPYSDGAELTNAGESASKQTCKSEELMGLMQGGVKVLLTLIFINPAFIILRTVIRGEKQYSGVEKWNILNNPKKIRKEAPPPKKPPRQVWNGTKQNYRSKPKYISILITYKLLDTEVKDILLDFKTLTLGLFTRDGVKIRVEEDIW